jgi:chitodextrinase
LRPLHRVLVIILTLFFVLQAEHGSAQTLLPIPIPSLFQDVFTSLNNDLYSFNNTLKTKWNGSKYPFLSTGTLTYADANSGPELVTSGYLPGVQNQLQGLKAMGVKAIMVEVGFPMLYRPFFSSQTQYQQFVDFYAQVAASVRAAGLKLIVENEFLLSNDPQDGWGTGAFYATLNWTQYQQARAQTAQVVAQTMHPDYMVVLQEPDTEASMTGHPEANTVSGATAMLTQILSAVQQVNATGIKVGAGVGSWHAQYLQFTQSFVTLPLDFIDMHIFPVNNNFLSNALTIASTAAAAGKPVSIAQAWIWTVRDSELGVLTADQVRARNVFSFWAPVDAYFIQTLENLANYTQMAFMNPFNSQLFWAYLTYDSSFDSLPPAQVVSQNAQQAAQNAAIASYTSTGVGYYHSIVSPADTVPPSTPTNLAGVSGAPTTAFLTWNASSDNVGVAGYYVFRNGVNIATTIQTQYQDLALTGSTTYSYAVIAFDLARNRAPATLAVPITTKDVIAPSAPANVTATAMSCQLVKLMWSVAADDVAVGSYRIFRGTSPASLSQVATTFSTTFSYTDFPLASGTTYYYALEAADTSGNVSSISAIVVAITLALPSPPTNLVATPISSKQIKLSWSAGPSGMTLASYQVFHGTSPSTLSKIGTVAMTSFTDYSLSPATAYYYAVKERDTGGNLSPFSTIISTTTRAR